MPECKDCGALFNHRSSLSRHRRGDGKNRPCPAFVKRLQASDLTSEKDKVVLCNATLLHPPQAPDADLLPVLQEKSYPTTWDHVSLTLWKAFDKRYAHTVVLANEKAKTVHSLRTVSGYLVH
jgi:hypothetical protein